MKKASISIAFIMLASCATVKEHANCDTAWKALEAAKTAYNYYCPIIYTGPGDEPK